LHLNGAQFCSWSVECCQERRWWSSGFDLLILLKLKLSINLGSCLLDFLKFIYLIFFSFDHKLVHVEVKLLKNCVVQFGWVDLLLECSTFFWDGSNEFLLLWFVLGILKKIIIPGFKDFYLWNFFLVSTTSKGFGDLNILLQEFFRQNGVSHVPFHGELVVSLGQVNDVSCFHGGGSDLVCGHLSKSGNNLWILLPVLGLITLEPCF
jgi:hypothetical protein